MLDLEDDTSVYFTPESGNVIFASALDGWGFRYVPSYACGLCVLHTCYDVVCSMLVVCAVCFLCTKVKFTVFIFIF